MKRTKLPPSGAILTPAEFRRARLLALSERAFQREVVAEAQRLGWLAVHFGAARTLRGWRTPCRADGKGFVDLVLVHPVRGRILFIEVKRQEGRLTEDQIRWLDALQRAGAEACVIRPGDWDALVKLLEGQGS